MKSAISKTGIFGKQFFSQLVLVAVGVMGATSAWGQPAAPMPFAADCIFLELTYLNRVEAELGKDGRLSVAEGYEREKKSYSNVQSQPDPVLVVAQIKSHIETLSRPGIPQQSLKFAQDNLTLQESMLCWMDYFARRPHSFPASARAAYMVSLRTQQQQELAAEVAREAARPDDPKTVGRGMRGG